MHRELAGWRVRWRIVVGVTAIAFQMPIVPRDSVSLRAQSITPTVNDLAYATVTNDDGSLATMRLDLWQSSDASQRAPVLIWIHGGGWQSGTYNNPPPGLQALLDSGYAVASVQYRLSGSAIFPAQIHDVKGAVRFLRAHSTEYNLDASQFAAWGSSAGGHLTTLLATSGDVPELEGTTGGNLEYSSRIQAAIDYFGPTDLLQMSADVTTPPGSSIDHDAFNSPESKLIGFSDLGEGLGVLRENLDNPTAPFPEKATLARLVNPIEHLDAADPPVFIAHGDLDTTVPLGQSLRLATAFEEAGIEHVMRVVVGAGHGFGTQGPTVNAEAIAFITEQLARTPGDYNGDGVVDDQDYWVWKQEYGTNHATADGNGDGIVDAVDYTVWRNSLPSGSSNAAKAVPEAGVSLLVVSGACATGWMSRLRCGAFRRRPGCLRADGICRKCSRTLP
jgi:acetyl esterase/lipase